MGKSKGLYKQLNKNCTPLKRKSIALLLVLTLTLCAGCTQGGVDSSREVSAVSSPISQQELSEKLALITMPDAAKAAVISKIKTSTKSLALTFDGLGSSETIKKLLDCLDENGIKATFFLTGKRVAEEPDIGVEILNRGHQAENFTLSGQSLDGLSLEQIYTEIERTDLILKNKLGVEPQYLRTADKTPSDDVLKTAAVCNLKAVSGFDVDVFADTKPAEELTQYFVNHISRGNILRFDTAASDKDLELLALLLKELCAQNYQFVSLDELRQRNDIDDAANYDAVAPDSTKKSDVFTYAYTTQEAVALTFDGLGSKEMLIGILDALDQSEIKATFFLSGYAVSDNPDMAKGILARGHEIENATLSFSDMTKLSYSEACMQIKEADKILKENLGITPKYLRSKFGVESDTTLSAAAVLGYTVVGYSKNPLDGDMKSAKEIEDYIRKRITRGEIILLNADKNPEVIKAIPLIANYVYDIGYKFVTIDELYTNQYERKPLEEIPGYNAVKIDVSKAALTGALPKPLVWELPASLGKTVALTFDDWGSDRTITQVLHILKANNVKASFFLRGNGVDRNPNLAKAIAEDGHDIGNHTYSHSVITELNPQQLQADIIKCHQVLTYAIQRQPEMMFRPPTFEIDETAAKVVEASGYKNIIQYQLSPHDYDPQNSADDIYNEIVNGVKPGSIITLHILDDSSVLKVLQPVITNLKSNGYRFAKVSDCIK